MTPHDQDIVSEYAQVVAIRDALRDMDLQFENRERELHDLIWEIVDRRKT